MQILKPIFPGSISKICTVSHSFSCQMDELGRAILNLCNVVPGGVVCFLPSYEYEKRLYTHWTTTGCLDKINSKKKVKCSCGDTLTNHSNYCAMKVFREPKMASQVETVLTQYSRCIEVHTHCLL